jgi:hypothetical protein
MKIYRVLEAREQATRQLLMKCAVKLCYIIPLSGQLPLLFHCNKITLNWKKTMRGEGGTHAVGEAVIDQLLCGAFIAIMLGFVKTMMLHFIATVVYLTMHVKVGCWLTKTSMVPILRDVVGSGSG